MKKLIKLIALAAVCSLSTAAVFGFSACDSDDETPGEEVTEEVWKEAFNEEPLNVTVQANYSFVETYTDGSTESGSGEAMAKIALTQDTNNVYIGATSIVDSESTVEKDATGATVENYDDTTICYTSYSTTAYEYVEYYSTVDHIDSSYSDTDWYGYQSTSLKTDVDDDNAYYIASMFLVYADYYSMFTFEDGAYTYSDSGNSVSVKINDGHVSSIVMNATYSGTYYTATEYYNIKYTNWGTTTVEIPEEYTYTYYSAHNAS